MQGSCTIAKGDSEFAIRHQPRTTNREPRTDKNQVPMPIPTALHDRTAALCESLSYRDWAGYYAVSSYETHHDHEYHAVRNSAGLIDVTPLFKYRIAGRDAVALVDRIITRDASKMAVGQVVYTPWCDERGHVIDDGTVARLQETEFRWTAADPNLRWFRQNATGLEVAIEDVSRALAAMALQGPMAAEILRRAADADVETLRYFRVTTGTIAGVRVDVSRTGYTGDLGYEIWTPWAEAPRVWDRLIDVGRAFALHPVGLLAVDMVRIEAGLLLIDVDFHSSRKALISSQRYSPFEMGFDRLVSLDKTAPFVGRVALVEEHRRGPARRIVGLEIDWVAVERLHERAGLPPQAPAGTSRVAVPVYAERGRHVGKATSTMWSPLLKKLIALATVEARVSVPGTRLEIEVTVDAVRHRVAATVVATPFFNPARKTRTPA